MRGKEAQCKEGTTAGNRKGTQNHAKIIPAKQFTAYTDETAPPFSLKRAHKRYPATGHGRGVLGGHGVPAAFSGAGCGPAPLVR